jgi:hypothetical protein
MKTYKYFINNNYLTPKEAEEWMKKNESVKVQSYLFEDDKLLYRWKEYHFINGYFMGRVYGVNFVKLPLYLNHLPIDPYTESVKHFFDEKMWCPIQ